MNRTHNEQILAVTEDTVLRVEVSMGGDIFQFLWECQGQLARRVLLAE
jgi:hypothetical protein